MTGVQTCALPICFPVTIYWPGNTSIIPTKDMLKLRYANYPKDYFMGMLPASQYGSVASLFPISSTADSRSIINDNLSTVQGTLRSQTGSAAPVLSQSSTINTNLRLLLFVLLMVLLMLLFPLLLDFVMFH